MSFQAYLDNVKEKTGKTPDDFIKLAREKSLSKHAELLAWLKSDFDLGTGHARAIIHVIQNADVPRASTDDAVAKHFSGGKAVWQKTYDDLLGRLNQFGSDVSVSPTSTYISLLRKGKKFGVVQVTAKNLDIGIKLKGTPAGGRYTEAGSWNTMMTHRVRIDEAAQVDAELLIWLRKAYDKA